MIDITNQVFRDLLDVAMINDSTTEQVEGMTWLRDILTRESIKRSYTGYIDAYHRFKV